MIHDIILHCFIGVCYCIRRLADIYLPKYFFGIYCPTRTIYPHINLLWLPGIISHKNIIKICDIKVEQDDSSKEYHVAAHVTLSTTLLLIFTDNGSNSLIFAHWTPYWWTESTKVWTTTASIILYASAALSALLRATTAASTDLWVASVPRATDSVATVLWARAQYWQYFEQQKYHRQ